MNASSNLRYASESYLYGWMTFGNATFLAGPNLRDFLQFLDRRDFFYDGFPSLFLEDICGSIFKFLNTFPPRKKAVRASRENRKPFFLAGAHFYTLPYNDS
jgi:hypothetical protein